jgi:hypothetical protein
VKKSSGSKSATTRTQRPAAARAGSPVQGEGDYVAGRRYRQSVETFVRTADIDQAARAAAPKNAREARALKEAEAVGRSRARRDPKDRMR